MDEVVKSLLDTLDQIMRATTDRAEKNGVSRIMDMIEKNPGGDMELTLKSARDDLFHHKGPLYDSFDKSEVLKDLRSNAYDAVKKAINHFIGIRQAKAEASRK